MTPRGSSPQSGFTEPLPVRSRQPGPPDQVVGTIPVRDRSSVDTLIQIQVSRGNQLSCRTCGECSGTDAEPSSEPRLDRHLIKLPTRRTAVCRPNGVVTQDPAAGTPIRFEGPITLSFAQ